jgi:hypothetical protein
MNILEENKTNILIGAIATGALYAMKAIDSKSILPYFVGTSLVAHVVRMGYDGEHYEKPTMESYKLDPYNQHFNQHNKYKCKHKDRYPSHNDAVCRSSAIIHV